MGSFRTTLAISVVLAHLSARHLLVGGSAAVQLFYCVSGFLIAYVLTQGESYTTKRSFYINRALRIYPVYYAVAAVALVLSLHTGTEFMNVLSAISSLGKLALGFVNFSIFGQDWVMFLALHAGKIQLTANFRASDLPLYLGLLIPQAWTLGVELSFYVLAPFLVTSLRRIWMALAIAAATKAALIYLGLATTDPWSYRFFPAEMVWFMLGALSMRLLLPRFERYLEANLRITALSVFSVLGLLVIYPLLPGSGEPGSIRSTILIGLVLVLLPAMFVFQKQMPFDKAIGELSYPIYICHMLVFDLSTMVLARFSMDKGVAANVAKLVAVIAVAYGLNRFVAEPIEKLRKRFRRPLPVQAAMGCH